jgi:hypothetical protein
MAEEKSINLAAAAELLKTRGVEVQANTLKKYAAGPYKPSLPAHKVGKTWRVYPADVIEWAGAYKAAPPRGVRRRKTPPEG